MTIRNIKANYMLLNHDGTIASFYRWRDVKYNNGTTEKTLEFLSHFDIWQPSINHNDEFMNKLVKIEGAIIVSETDRKFTVSK